MQPVDMHRPTYFGCPTDAELKAMGRDGPRPGSSPAICARCAAGVWVGPRQSTVLAIHPHATILCIECSVFVQAITDAELKVLGGPGS